MINNDIDSKELREMKEQLALLTRQLEKEEIISKRMIRQAMKSKAYSLRRDAIIEGVICIILAPLYIWLAPLLGFSIYFSIFTALFLLFAAYYNYHMHSQFDPENFIDGNIVEVKSVDGFISENEAIEIVRISGDAIFVERVKNN